MLNQNQISSIESQLWRYYDIEIDIQSAIPNRTQNSNTIWYIYGISGRKIIVTFKFSTDMDNIWDLYLYEDGKFTDPTTTLEEQENR